MCAATAESLAVSVHVQLSRICGVSQSNVVASIHPLLHDMLHEIAINLT